MKSPNLAIVKMFFISSLIYILLFFVSSVLYGTYRFAFAGASIPKLFVSACYIVPGIFYAQRTAKKIRNHHRFEKDYEKLRNFLARRKSEILLTLFLFASCVFLYRMIAIETLTGNMIHYLYFPLFLSKIMVEPVVYFHYYAGFGSFFKVMPWLTQLFCIYIFSLMAVGTKKMVMTKVYFR